MATKKAAKKKKATPRRKKASGPVFGDMKVAAKAGTRGTGQTVTASAVHVGNTLAEHEALVINPK